MSIVREGEKERVTSYLMWLDDVDRFAVNKMHQVAHDRQAGVGKTEGVLCLVYGPFVTFTNKGLLLHYLFLSQVNVNS